MAFIKTLGLLALVTVALLIVAACGSDDPTPTPTLTPEPTPTLNSGEDETILGEPFTLKVGQSVTLAEAGMTLSFVSVTQDSRCPSDVTCVQAGSGTVALTVVRTDGQRDELRLPIGSGGEFTARSPDFAITVSNLLPYPVSTLPIAPTDYQVTVAVRAR